MARGTTVIIHSRSMTPSHPYLCLGLSLALLAAAAAVAPHGPDNLTAEESSAVQGAVDRFFRLFNTSNTANNVDCAAWVRGAFPLAWGLPDAQFNHPPPLGVMRGQPALESFCVTVRKISKVQEMRQNGPYTWIATAANHTQLDVLMPALYVNDAPFAKTMHILLRMAKYDDAKAGGGWMKRDGWAAGVKYMTHYGSEILTTTQSTFTFPAN